jgi:hypothetical protein
MKSISSALKIDRGSGHVTWIIKDQHGSWDAMKVTFSGIFLGQAFQVFFSVVSAYFFCKSFIFKASVSGKAETSQVVSPCGKGRVSRGNGARANFQKTTGLFRDLLRVQEPKPHFSISDISGISAKFFVST